MTDYSDRTPGAARPCETVFRDEHFDQYRSPRLDGGAGDEHIFTPVGPTTRELLSVLAKI